MCFLKKFNLPQGNKDAVEALAYHKKPRPGKLAIIATKQLNNQRDLALAYSPGVAHASEAIFQKPLEAFNLTSKGNLVAVISNGTAVLGLGDIGPLASKPVMEGKAVLFKKFAGIDVFDLEINETNPGKLTDIIASLEPTFGGINLEDIKAPECFEIESALSARLNIPVFHDDQHGTAITVVAGILNGLDIAKKKLPDAKIVVSGAGAAALACLDLLTHYGLLKKNVWLFDSQGLVTSSRNDLSIFKKPYAQNHPETLEKSLEDCDIFLGLSKGNLLTQHAIKPMASCPLIFALANPLPEIMPEEALKSRPDAIIATGRSDYPNQVNNILCFPYIFRGALDVLASHINLDMKKAAVKAIADLAKEPLHDRLSEHTSHPQNTFGPQHILPIPFDPRLLERIATTVAKAAIKTGVAKKKIADWEAYQDSLTHFSQRARLFMRPLLKASSEKPQRILITNWRNPYHLRAAHLLVENKVATPCFLGPKPLVQQAIKKEKLTLLQKKSCIFDPSDPTLRKSLNKKINALQASKNNTDLTAEKLFEDSGLLGAVMLAEKHVNGLISTFSEKTNTPSAYQKKIHQWQTILSPLQNATHQQTRYAPFKMEAFFFEERSLFLTDLNACESTASTIEFLAEKTLRAVRKIEKFCLFPEISFVTLPHTKQNSSPSYAPDLQTLFDTLCKKAPHLIIHKPTSLEKALLDQDCAHPKNPKLLIIPDAQTLTTCSIMLKAQNPLLRLTPLLLGLPKPAYLIPHTEENIETLFNLMVSLAVEAQPWEKNPVCPMPANNHLF